GGGVACGAHGTANSRPAARRSPEKEQRMTTATRTKTYVVDADGHVLEPATALVELIDPAYRDRAPRIVERDGKEYWAGDAWGQTGAGPATAGAGMAGVARWKDQKEVMASDAGPYTPANPAGFSPEPRLRVMDAEGFDAAVLYPTNALAYIPDAPYALALNRAYNDW